MTSIKNSKDNCICIEHYYDRKPKLKLQTETTNHAHYKPLPIEKQIPFEVPKVQQKHYDPQLLQTSYKNHYVKKQINNDNNIEKSASSTIQNYMKRKPHVPFYSETSYTQHYKLNPIQIQKQPTYEYKPNNTKFQGQSSYKAQFVVKKASSDLVNAGQTIANTKDYMNRKPKIAFQGQSAYKQMFKPHQIKIQKQPQYKYSKNPNKFEGSSSYKDTYKMPPKQAFQSDLQKCPVHPSKVAIK